MTGAQVILKLTIIPEGCAPFGKASLGPFWWIMALDNTITETNDSLVDFALLSINAHVSAEGRHAYAEYYFWVLYTELVLIF